MSDVRTSDPRFAPAVRVSSVKFMSFTSEEIKKLSCNRITNPVSFDSLLHPTPGGLYDPSLGPTDRKELCGTCGLNYIHCPGHMGHISLPLPVFHPIFFPALYQILQSSCLACHHLLATSHNSHLLKGRMKLLDEGLVSDALDMKHSIKKTEESTDSTADDISTVTEYVERCIERKEKREEEGKWRGHLVAVEKSKHLTDARNVVQNEFFKSIGTKCPHCKAPARKIRHEYQNKVMLRGLSAKLAGMWAAAANKEKRKQEVIGKEIEETVITPKMCTEQQYLTPLEAMSHLRQIWDRDPLLMMSAFPCLKKSEEVSCEMEDKASPHPTDMFFMDTVPVPPSRFRPISTLGAKKFENSQTTNLQKILKDCVDIQEILVEKNNPAVEELKEDPKKPKQSLNERLQYCWSSLQMDVNTLMDSDINKKMKDLPNGIKQILEKKEGLFRKHMMGKRVNYACRSVISPDPNISMDEIGIPLIFATGLTYPEPVTHWNVHELRQAVINGPNVYPGATHVQNEDGSMILLNARNPTQRQGLARRLLAPNKIESLQGSVKKVHRHLKNGDVLLLNRQPTLHKPSIMAHKARVLPGEKTLRLHYANCKTYNADFDGDEMNAHFPQNELSRSEAYNIVLTHHQYLVPKDGTPLSGLIQDHVVSGVLLTIRGQFFNWEDYQRLLFVALPHFTSSFRLIPPSILKPQRLWSGKQVISTLLLNLIPEDQDKLNLVSKSKVSTKEWSRCCKPNKKSKYSDTIMSESEVIFREGLLVCGVLDKSQFGASQFGFVHSCYELYGGEMCNILLSALGRIFTGFLQLHGFTLGVEDILVTAQADKERTDIISEGRGCGPEAAAEALSVKNINDHSLIQEKYQEIHHSTDDNGGMKILDYCMKKRTDQINNRINTACVPAGLYLPFPKNSLQLMVQAGAKGSTVNCMQISCLLGQIELEGRRPPLMLSGKSLPSFSAYDTCPRAGGFVDGRFLTGIRPQEYFFHCMAGREGLVDTAVKTSRSGYLQRCLIKHLEGITVQYDLTVRDSDGSVIQFLYGEDGLDISKTRFLTPKQMNFMAENYKAMLYQLDLQSAVKLLDSVKAIKFQRKVDRWKRKDKDSNLFSRPRRSGFLKYYEKHLPEIAEKYSIDKRHPDFNYRSKAERDIINSWYSSSPMLRADMNSKCNKNIPPTISMYRPDRHFGSVPEKLTDQLNSFISENSYLFLDESKYSLTRDKFRTLLQFKCLKALAEPGEAVGLLAAQSIGEPSTQMTLNTFHFAGRGEMNVTLGIPRLREILMTASPNIKTPAMDVPLISSPDAKEKGEKLKKRFTQVLLRDVLDQVEVWENLDRVGSGFHHRVYKVKMTFLEPKYYKDEYVVNPSMILKFIETVFIKKLVAAVNKEIKTIRDKKDKSVAVVPDKEHVLQSCSQQEKEDINNEADVSQAALVEEDETDVSDIDEENHSETKKQMTRKKQQVSYEDADDEDKEAMESIDTKTKGKEDQRDEGIESDIEDTETSDLQLKNKTMDSSIPLPAVSNKLNLDPQRVEAAISSSSHLTDYIYDTDNEKWCQLDLKFGCVDCKVMMASLIEKLANKVVVWEVPNVKKGFLVESQLPGEAGLLRLKTEGVNMQELWKYEDIPDLRKAYTNNIHSTAATFGIEAAVKSIIKEISEVFKVYGINVDYRHLSLIADYMTFDGTYKPFNRFGMETNSSPFQQMSFETTMKFLRTATIQGEVDMLQSPSSCLVTGRVVHGGTGAFELLQKLT